jgi:threonine aldolase
VVLAACGIVALEEVRPRLREDHERARTLAGLLAAMPFVEIDLESVMINMVFFRFRGEASVLNADGQASRRLVERLRSADLVKRSHGRLLEMVTHLQTDDAAVEGISQAIANDRRLRALRTSPC